MAAPTVESVTPDGGSSAGGMNVTIEGTHYKGVTAVTFGGTPATSFKVESVGVITAVAPAKAAGPCDVQVTTADGTSATGSDTYTYRDVLPVTQVPDRYAASADTGVAPTYTAADATNGNYVESTGDEILLVQNADGGGPHDVTITSTADEEGRSGDITVSVPASSEALFQRLPKDGFAGPGGLILVTGATSDIKIAVLRLQKQ